MLMARPVTVVLVLVLVLVLVPVPVPVVWAVPVVSTGTPAPRRPPARPSGE
ncbi:hypothetical protein GCM10010317_032620 [Streptomyces mirabilis]|nr:hypothetical protein GCM10010317_032620 [Streptomyces mirabilis]